MVKIVKISRVDLEIIDVQGIIKNIKKELMQAKHLACQANITVGTKMIFINKNCHSFQTSVHYV